MSFSRRSLLLGAASLGRASAGHAQVWSPTRPVRIIAAWGAGGSADSSLRVVAPPMQAILGQTIVIENRGGASGSIGAAAVAQAAPDGYTLLFDAAGQVSNPFLMRGLGFDYEAAFAPICLFALVPNVLCVRVDAPVHNVAELVAHLRAHPGTPYASTGIGLASHLAAVMFATRGRLEVTHVPYRSSPQSVVGLLGGDTFFTFNTTPAVMPLIRDGRLRALAVGTPARIPALPDTPTMMELGYQGFSINEWLALFAPAGTPARSSPVAPKPRSTASPTRRRASAMPFSGWRSWGRVPPNSLPSSRISAAASVR